MTPKSSILSHIFKELPSDPPKFKLHIHFVSISSRLKVDLLKKNRTTSAIKTMPEKIRRLPILKAKISSAPAKKTTTNGINMRPAIWFAPRTSFTRDDAITAISMLRIAARGARSNNITPAFQLGK